MAVRNVFCKYKLTYSIDQVNILKSSKRKIFTITAAGNTIVWSIVRENISNKRKKQTDIYIFFIDMKYIISIYN